MKNSILFLCIVLVVLACGNNSRSKLPTSGNYGTKVKTDSVITVNDAINLMQSNTKANVNVTGIVEKVCAGEGCWLTLENKNGKALFVEVENKAFVLPLNIEGKLATITGMVVKDTNTNKIKVLAKAINIQ
jgi:flagellar basal body rod protein FlgG